MVTSFMRRAVPLMILAVGCSDGSGPGDVGDGEFEFTVTGELDRTVTGDAFFVVGDGGAGEDGLAIVLSTGQRQELASAIESLKPKLPEADAAKADAIERTLAGAPCGELCKM